MTTFLILLLIFFCNCMSQTQIAQTYDLQSNELLYRTEIFEPNPFKTEFQYFSPTNKLIAIKTFTFEKSCPWSPSVKLQNFQYDQKLDLILERNSSTTPQKAQIKNSLNGANKRRNFLKPCNLIWGLGIHRFILAHWDALQKGPIDIELFALNEAKSFSFTLSMNENLQVYLIPRSHLLKMFVDDIYFQYNHSKELVKFLGMSDILDANGKSQRVRVVYQKHLL